MGSLGVLARSSVIDYHFGKLAAWSGEGVLQKESVMGQRNVSTGLRNPASRRSIVKFVDVLSVRKCFFLGFIYRLHRTIHRGASRTRHLEPNTQCLTGQYRGHWAWLPVVAK